MSVPSDFPWRAGMLTLPDARGIRVRVFRVPALRDGNPYLARRGRPIADGLNVAAVHPRSIGADMIDELDENDKPDPTDPATLGALLGAVRDAFGKPYLETVRGRGGFFLVDFAPENEPVDDNDYPSLRADGTFGFNAKPEVSGADRFALLLTAWNARPR